MFARLVILTAACACGAVAQGCGSSPGQSASSMATAGSTNPATTAAEAGQPAAPPPMHVASMPASTPAAGSGGSAGATLANPPTQVASAAGGAGVSGAAGAGGAAASQGHERMPCDVAAVFKQQCQSCHGETLNLGAPMHLVTWSDLHTPAVSDASKMVFEMVAVRVQDAMRPMPPKMNGKLAVADRMLLVNWSSQGAPPLAGDAPDCP